MSAATEKLRWALEHPSRFCRYILGFTPTWYQNRLANLFLACDYITVRWCRQSGKTHMIAALLLWYALTHPGAHIAVVGPSWRQTKLVIRRINAFMQKLPKAWQGKPRKTYVELPNGSRIEAFPNNPDTIRGPTLDVVYCDEMNFIPNDEEMFDAIMWTLVTKRRGKFICSSTPWNTDSVFYRIWHDPAFKDYCKLHITWRDALEPKGPLTRDKIEQLRRQYEGDPWRWTREMEAEWSEETDVWLDQGLLTKCIDGDLELFPVTARKIGEFYVGVDLGKVRDYSVVAVVDRDENGVLRLLHCHRFPLGTPYASVVGYIKLLQERWITIRRVFVDQTGVGEPIVEEMMRGGIRGVEGVKFTEPRKEEMATLLKQTMLEGLLRLPYDRDIIAELNVERFEITKSGRIKFSHPEGTHDDRFWAMALAVAAARAQPAARKRGFVTFGRPPR